MATKRFEFAGGDYWEIYTEKTWGAQRAVERLARSFLNLERATVNAATGELTGEVLLDPEKFDPSAANEALLLHSTVAWSYGAITAEGMAKIPMAHVQLVLDYVNEVYPKQDPLVILTPGVEQPKSSLSPSSERALYRRKWWMPTFSMRRDGHRKSSMPNR